MSAEYTMQEMNDLHAEGKTLRYPRMIISSRCDTDELVRLAAEGTTFGIAEIRGILDRLAQIAARQMARGRSVQLAGIGTFTPSLTLKEGKEREE